MCGPDDQQDVAMAELDSNAPVVLEAPPKSKKRKREREKVRPKKQPPYAVIVENDDFHTFDYVIEVLQKVFGYDLQKAFQLTKQVHLAGQALVWSGALELAELKRDQIRGYGPDTYAMKPVTFPLGVRVEQLPG
jgi:ATP-dependent Clp protease adaptor protein ClpS